MKWRQIKMNEIENKINSVIDRVSLEVTEKIKSGEIKTIEDLHNTYYNEKIDQEMKAIYVRK